MMRVTEDVQLTGFDRPSPVYMDLVSASGYDARDLGDSIILRAPYEPGKYETLVGRIGGTGLAPKIYRGFSTEWSDEDFARADLLSLTLPELDLDDFYEEENCPQCGRGTAARDYGRRVSKVKTKHKVATAGIWADLVYKTVKERAENELRGVTFVPFDEAGDFFQVKPGSEIRQQTVHPGDGINIREACPSCGRVQYDAFFGPLRYHRAGWTGDDVVYSDFLDTLLYTPRAYDLLRAFDRDVKRLEPVYLE